MAKEWEIVTEITISNMSLTDGCFYCGEKADTWDHIVPRKRKGNDDYENLVPCCRSCNSIKNDRTLCEFRQYLRKKGKRADFDTPDPHSVIGLWKRNPGTNKMIFIGSDGITITDFFELHARMYSDH